MKHSILIGLAASTLAMAAFAQDTTPSADSSKSTPSAANSTATDSPTFMSLDQNSDGRITTSESMGAKDLSESATFKKADVNGDGALDKAEFDSWKSASSMPKATQPGTPSSVQ